MEYEESLDRDAYDWHWDPREDRYDQMADAVEYHVLEGTDDRPAWERGLTDLRCRRCEREPEVDALGTCESCRRADGRCTLPLASATDRRDWSPSGATDRSPGP
jgi:hypothetical protein